MRYNLYYITDKGSQLVDYSNHRSDFEKYMTDLSLDGKFELIEKRGLIDFSLIKINKSFREHLPLPSKLEHYRILYNDCKEELLRHNPIVVNEQNNYLTDGYCSYLILKEQGVEGNIPVSLYGNDNRIRLVYGKHKPNGKEYVWKIKNDKFKRIGAISEGDKLNVATRYGLRTITVTKTELVPYSLELSAHKKVKGRIKGDSGG